MSQRKKRKVRPPEGYMDKPVEGKRLLMNVKRILAVQRKGKDTSA